MGAVEVDDDDLVRAARCGGPMPATVCQEIAKWAERQKTPAELRAFVKMLPDVIVSVQATTDALSRRADDLTSDGRSLGDDPELQDWMWHLGAAINMLAFAAARAVQPGLDAPEVVDHVEDLTTSVVGLPWRAWSPLSVLAFRSLALIYSKQDDYERAWGAHEDAKQAVERHRSEAVTEVVGAMLDDVYQQLWLSESGTGCRELEWYLREGVAEHHDDPAAELLALIASVDPIDRAIASARQAWDITQRIDAAGRLGRKSEYRLLHRGSYRQPGVMGARACLLKMVLCEVMCQARHPPPDDRPSWAEQAQNAFWQFFDFYRLAEDPRDALATSDDDYVPILDEHQRSLVQHLLMFAVLFPDQPFEPRRQVPASLNVTVLDAAALEALSEELLNWKVGGEPRPAGANTIGQSISPMFNAAVDKVRSSVRYVGPTYREWRLRYPTLDRREERTSSKSADRNEVTLRSLPAR